MPGAYSAAHGAAAGGDEEDGDTESAASGTTPEASPTGAANAGTWDAAAPARQAHGSGAAAVVPAWTQGVRHTRGVLAPPEPTQKPTIDSLQKEFGRQVQLCHRQTQQDLDLLHSQIHSEVRDSVTQELQRIEKLINTLRIEAAQFVAEQTGAVQKRLGDLTLRVENVEKSQQAASADNESLCEAVQSSAVEGAKALHKVTEALRGEFRAEASRLDVLDEKIQQLSDAQESIGIYAKETVDAKLRELFDMPSDAAENSEAAEEGAEAAEAAESSEAAGSGGASRRLLELIDSRLEGLVDRTTMEYCVNDCVEELVRRLEDEAALRSKAVEAARGEAARACAGLEGALQGESALGRARYNEAQAAVADLEARVEKRQGQSLREAIQRQDTLEVRVSDLSKCVKEQTSGDEEVRQVGEECRRRLDMLSSSWARCIEWQAEVDAAGLQASGRTAAESPVFSAACISGLQLRLTVARAAPGAKRQGWVYGAFLRAPHGHLAFRLYVDGVAQDFAGTFGTMPQVGSQKLATFDAVRRAVTVKLVIFNVMAELTDSLGWHPSLSAIASVADTAHAASQEAATLRSSMVRRVEWRILKVAEHVANARAASAAGDDEALEPVCSPPFTAAGLEGLQLRFYPIGYRARTDDGCGFFLVCPAGVSVKCRAFVGDVVKIIEHTYEEQEPYGRGSFCRLADKIKDDGSVTCGVEFLEVKRAVASEVKGGPFGSIEDSVKLIAGAVGLDTVRELREVPDRRSERRGAARAAAEGSASPPAPAGAAPGRTPAGSRLAGSKSLPILLPAVTEPGGPTPHAMKLAPEARRQFDLG